MKKVLLLSIISLLSFFYSNVIAQSYTKVWDRTYGGDSTEWQPVIKSQNNSLFVSGMSISGITGNKTQALCGLTVREDRWNLKLEIELI